MPFTLILIAADIHASTASEELVDAGAPIKVDQGYVPMSARWQQGGGAVYREPISVLHRGWMVPVVGVLQRDQVTRVDEDLSSPRGRINHSRRRGSDRARSNRPARRSALGSCRA